MPFFAKMHADISKIDGLLALQSLGLKTKFVAITKFQTAKEACHHLTLMKNCQAF